jgi:hypothetical protein
VQASDYQCPRYASTAIARARCRRDGRQSWVCFVREKWGYSLSVLFFFFFSIFFFFFFFFVFFVFFFFFLLLVFLLVIFIPWVHLDLDAYHNDQKEQEIVGFGNDSEEDMGVD